MKKWITISEASALTGKPSRTIRDQAVKGKIQFEKSGKIYLFNRDCLIKRGWIKNPELEQKSEPELELKPESESKIKKKPEGSEKKEKYHLRNLGVYNELLEYEKNFRKSIQIQPKEDLKKEPIDDLKILEHIVNGIYFLGIGFYEVHTKQKIDCYRSTQFELVKTLISLHRKEKQNKKELEPDKKEPNDFILKLEESLLPGLRGLIRKMESPYSDKRNYNKNNRPTYPSKN